MIVVEGGAWAASQAEQPSTSRLLNVQYTRCANMEERDKGVTQRRDNQVSDLISVLGDILVQSKLQRSSSNLS